MSLTAQYLSYLQCKVHLIYLM